MTEPPVARGFVPLGIVHDPGKAIQLFYEEYEAVRLSDYLNLSHEEASRIMGISRPTFTRIYESARKKIARALTDNCSILIDGGMVQFEGEWFRCKKCFSIFNIPLQGKDVSSCPVCHALDLIHLNTYRGIEDIHEKDPCQSKLVHGSAGYCLCPECGMKISHQPGLPCRNLSCPQCKVSMVRGADEKKIH